VFNIGPAELLLILIIALVVFGPQKLPEIGRTLGRSLREFRKASNELREELKLDVDGPERARLPGDKGPPPDTRTGDVRTPSGGEGGAADAGGPAAEGRVGGPGDGAGDKPPTR
jgi:sec-independent protein translocase protein TatA